jgi:predicted enzyme related to lactoylglutathione lyase
MPEYSTHTPGTFSWVELSTPDQNGAIAFYHALFGWDVNNQPMGPDELYSMFTIRGKEVGAAFTMRNEERKASVPPHWNMYVTVANVDAAATRAAELGAKVFAPPFDVMDAGRMAVLQDPTGAVFQVWQSNKHIGAKILNENGALCWSELTTRDPQAAEAFYTQMFGWTAEHNAPSTQMAYTEFHNNGTRGIGMMRMPPNMPPLVPSYWMPYFQVADCDASTEKVQTLGGALMVGPHDIPDTGRFSICRDPQGAMFALFTYKQH